VPAGPRTVFDVRTDRSSVDDGVDRVSDIPGRSSVPALDIRADRHGGGANHPRHHNDGVIPVELLAVGDTQ
jgi:hypothetical protein